MNCLLYWVLKSLGWLVSPVAWQSWSGRFRPEAGLHLSVQRYPQLTVLLFPLRQWGAGQWGLRTQKAWVAGPALPHFIERLDGLVVNCGGSACQLPSFVLKSVVCDLLWTLVFCGVGASIKTLSPQILFYRSRTMGLGIGVITLQIYWGNIG